MRPIWTGAISVGLVNVPVSIVSAYSHKGVQFRLMHAKDKGAIGYGRRCKKCGKEVAWENIKKAYQYKKGSYVMLDDKDFARVDPKLSKAIEVREIVDATAIDPIYIAGVHFLVPGANAEKAYFLLHETLARSGKVALAKMIMHEKEHWVAIRAAAKALQIIDLHFSDEIIDSADLGLPLRPAFKSEELRLARKMVGDLSGPFKPGRYRDEFEKKLKKLAVKKAKGKDSIVEEEAVPEMKVEDLMSALRRSVAEAKRRK